MSNDYLMPKDQYLSFDALTVRQFIQDQLTKDGIFSDHIYQGSNISAIINIVAFMYNALLYNLNQTSTQGTFSDTTIYENINRLVKLIDYKPLGKQTSILPFIMSANSSLSVGLYTIPRYSYITIGNVTYSFNEDITFAKTVAASETFTDLSNKKLLYNGQYIEYPLYTALGQNFETIVMTPGTNVKIDHFNIDVYVKQNGKWLKWQRVPSLYLYNSTDTVYELRLNENKNYEVKFGDDINGVRVDEGDLIQIYYLRSDGTDGEVGVGVLNGQNVVRYTTTQFNEILNDVVEPEINFLQDSQYANISFTNDRISTYSSDEETTDDIKKNAPKTFRSQYRLVTKDDFETYVKTNYYNIIHDVKAVNNWEYLSNQMKYYYDMGISHPNEVANLAYSQVMFADSCNFNNVYLYAVPKKQSTGRTDLVYLSPSQKELILNSMLSMKMMTTEVIINDPTYMAIGLYVENKEKDYQNIDYNINQTKLMVIKDELSRRDSNAIKNDINNVIINYFTRNNCYLGQVVDVNLLNAKILSISGVKKIYTSRKDNTNLYYEGLSFAIWNPIYEKLDFTVLQSNTRLSFFKFPYFYNPTSFINQIDISSNIKIFETVEF